MVQVAPSTKGRALGNFLTKATTGVAALRWIIIEVPHMSYKQAQCVFAVTQQKSISSESFMVSSNKKRKYKLRPIEKQIM